MVCRTPTNSLSFTLMPKYFCCQWTWIVANNWGSCHNGHRGMGCGPQETFRSCSDIAIMKSSNKTKIASERLDNLKKLYYLMKKKEKACINIRYFVMKKKFLNSQ